VEKTENLKSKKRIQCMLRSIGKQSGESMQSVLKKKMRLRWEGFTEKEGFQPGIKVKRG